MSVIKCLMQKAEAGLVSKKTAEKIAAEVSDLKTRIEAGSDVGKELEAAQQAFDIITHRLEQKAKQTAIHASLLKQGSERFQSGAPVKAVLKSFSFTDEANAYRYGYLGPAAHETVLHNQRMFTSMAADVLDNLSPTRMGILRDPGKQLDIRKDMFALFRGEGQRSLDPEVRKVSEGIQKLTTAGADAFDRAGGNITLRKDFMLGRSVNTDKVSKVGIDEYVQDSLAAFDLNRVRDATDGVISTQKDLAEALKADYRAVTSGGLSDLAEFAPAGVKSVVNSRNHHRIFHFKDAESMIAWNDKYGTSNLYQNVVDYAERIGRDIGILETYGPKPEAFIRSMLRLAAQRDPKASLEYKNAMYTNLRFITGQWDRALDPNIAKNLATYRNVNVAAKLGSTFKDAVIMDTFGLATVANRMRGLPALGNLAQDLKRFATPGMKDDYKLWARMGWYTDAFIYENLSQLRAAESEGGHKLAADMAQGVMKYSLLERKTQSAKGSAVRLLGDMMANTEWKDLDPNFHNWAQAHGVTEEVYNIARKFGSEDVENWGIQVVSPYKLYESGYTKEAALLGTLFNRAPEIVSPTSSPEFRAAVANAERSGKAAQIAIGSMKTFSGYLSSFYNNHFRVLAALPGYGNKAKYTAATALSLTMTGIVSTMLGDMLLGKDPTLTQETVLKAFTKANFLPVIGDFIFSGGSHYGSGGLGDRFGGVMLGDVSKASSAVSNALVGDFKKAGSDVQRLLTGLLPGQSLWFASLALKRTMLDQLRYLYDPDAEKYYKTKARKAESAGQPFWWAPGQTAPDRAPNLSNITEQPFFKPEKKGK